MGFNHYIAPQLARFQHIGFINRAQLFAARHRGFKTDTGDAAHLILIIGHDVIAFALSIRRRPHAFFAKIDVAIQFADDDHINLASNLWTQRRCVGQFGKQGCGAQIGKQRQFLAQAKDCLFGPQVPVQIIAVRITHRAKQDCVCALGKVQCRGG